MRTEAGYLHVGRVSGVALRVHWSTPLVAFLLSGVSFEPVLWACFLVIIVVHELGHAALVVGAGLQVVGIDLTGAGGQCRWRGRASELDRAFIAWGGVIAQLLLLAVALALRGVLGAPQSRAGFVALHAFVETNLWIAALNLLPIPPLDGARAWGLFGELERSGRSLGGLLLLPLRSWAGRRRRARGGATPDSEAPAPPPGGRWRRRRRHQSDDDPTIRAPTDGTRGPEAEAAADAEAPQPSAEAQRELAALLERIGDDAAKAKRRR